MQDKDFQGYPQNIQMVPQGANHQQIPVNLNQEGSFDQPNPYGNVPPTVIQQGVIYQAVPANPQMVMYPNSGYPAPGYPNHPQAAQYANYPVPNQMFPTSDQIHLMNPYNQVFMIETKIKSGFCCYSCLVYTGLIFTVIGVLQALSTGRHPAFQLLNILLSVGMIVGYVLAIQAKSTFDTKKQHQAYIIFCVLTAMKFIFGLLFVKPVVREAEHDMARSPNGFNRNDADLSEMDLEGLVMTSLVFQLLLDLLLVYYTHSVRKLMKDRDQILINLNSANRVA